MQFIDPKPAVACEPNLLAKPVVHLRMMRRRDFLRAARLLVAAPALLLPAEVALAQQVSGKPELRVSEVKPEVVQLVDKISREVKERNGVEFTPQQKAKMVNDIIAKMADGPYAFVDP
jgi:hypothetical protein